MKDQPIIRPGDLVMLDETKLPGDVEAIPVWNNVYDSFASNDPAYTQVDFVFFKDVVLVLGKPFRDGSVRVLTTRGRVGVAWIGHLRKIF
jgi:hypothetical protein